jgi:hypothetical protein
MKFNLIHWTPLIVGAVVLVIYLANKYADSVLNWINTPIGVHVDPAKFKTDQPDLERLDKAYFRLRARANCVEWETGSQELYNTLQANLASANQLLIKEQQKGGDASLPQIMFLKGIINGIEERLNKEPWASSFYADKTKDASASIKKATRS